MPSLVLNKKSLTVKLDGEHLVIRDNVTNDPPTTLPLVNIERVVIYGQPAITYAVLVRFMEMGLPCTFLSGHGKWRGAIGFEKGYMAKRRILQYDKCKDSEFCLRIAKHLIHAKIANSRRVLQRLKANREYKENEEYRLSSIQLNGAYASVYKAASIDELRGIEGSAAFHYFSLLRNFLPAELGFHTRNRHPPKDPVNALLSWTYSILLSEMIGIMKSHGLDVAAGVMHADKSFSPALALDLIEPLRTGCCDLIVVNLLNHKIVQAKHFEKGENEGVYLNDEGRKAFFNTYERTMQRVFVLPATGERTTFRQVLDYQVCQFLKMLEQGADGPFFLLP